MAGACVDAQCVFNEARGARSEIDGEKQASPRQLRAAGPRRSRDLQAEEHQCLDSFCSTFSGLD